MWQVYHIAYEYLRLLFSSHDWSTQQIVSFVLQTHHVKVDEESKQIEANIAQNHFVFLVLMCFMFNTEGYNGSMDA